VPDTEWARKDESKPVREEKITEIEIDQI